MKKLLFILLSIITVQATAQKHTDTVKRGLFTFPDTIKKSHSKPVTLILPAAFIAYGALSFEVHPVRRFDYYTRSEVAKSAPNFSTKADSYMQFAPVVMVYGLNFAGVEGKNTFIDRSALLGLSGVILGITALPTKHFTHRLRPNGSDYLSFPSGHTGTAFMGAEFMAQEYGDVSPWYSVLGYSVAATTGAFRIYNRDHWFSDVVAGAGFGILSTKAAYLIYPAIRNWLTHGDEKADKNGKKKASRNTLLMPSYQDGAVGLSFATEF